MKSANTVVAFPQAPERRDRNELAFLPAALEIVEAPPSPVGRAVALTIIALFCVALGWSCWGEVDVIASSPGKIVPSGRTKVIQPFETGVVRAIHVQDGQSVRAGDVLIELDPTLNNADREHLRSDLMAQQLEIARLRASLSGAADPLAEFRPPTEASPALIAIQRRLVQEQTAEHRAKLAALEYQLLQKKAERETVAATIARFEATIPLLKEQMDVYKTLYGNGNGSKLQYLHTLEGLTDRQHELLAQKSRYREAEAAIAAIEQARAQTVAEYRRTLFDQLAIAEAKAAGLAQDLAKAHEKTRLQQLVAPIDGTVQQLAIHTVGGVVTPAQPLLMIVPADTRLEIEAMVANRDIGFVQAGQEADVKVDTFNFTRYGLRHGRVLSVSQDAITRDRPQDRVGDREKTRGAESASSEPQGQELVYVARLSLDQLQMRVDERLINLTPGMAVTVEIKTGSQRIISYLLSPIIRYGHDSLRER